MLVSNTNNKLISSILCGIFASLMAIGAFVRIPLPAISFTLQNLFAVLAGTVLGPVKGVTSVGIYILAGCTGLPVFVSGGGLGAVLHPSFGFVIGFVFAAWIAGLTVKKGVGRMSCILSSWLGMAVIYVIGLPYYYIISRYYLGASVGVEYLVINCFLITFLPDVIKGIGAGIIAYRLKAVLK